MVLAFGLQQYKKKKIMQLNALGENKSNGPEIGPTRIQMFLEPEKQTAISICSRAVTLEGNSEY